MSTTLARLVAAAVLLAAYLVLGAAVSQVPPGGFDTAAEALTNHGVKLALFFTGAGRFPVFAVLCVALLLCGVVRRALLVPAAVAVGALLVAWKISDLLKDAFHRARPLNWVDIHESSFSYSSGHATLSLTFYGLLAYILWRALPPSSLRSAVPVVAGLWILATGWSRLALGAHFATDVLGGYLLGGGLLLIAAVVLDRVWPPTRSATLVAGNRAREVLAGRGSPP
jgi:undecaprenyl-diphosphatase